MTSPTAEHWPLWRALAFLLALFAFAFASLAAMPVMARGIHGDVPICVTGPSGSEPPAQTPKGSGGPTCSACVLPMGADMPAPPRIVCEAAPVACPESAPAADDDDLHLPVRAPPRPPSTAPPLA